MAWGSNTAVMAMNEDMRITCLDNGANEAVVVIIAEIFESTISKKCRTVDPDKLQVLGTEKRVSDGLISGAERAGQRSKPGEDEGEVEAVACGSRCGGVNGIREQSARAMLKPCYGQTVQVIQLQQSVIPPCCCRLVGSCRSGGAKRWRTAEKGMTRRACNKSVSNWGWASSMHEHGVPRLASSSR